MKNISCSLVIFLFVYNTMFTQSIDNRVLPIKSNGKWGFINISGKIIINPKFDGAEESYDGYLPVKIGEKWGYCDIVGKIITQPQFDYAGQFSEGLAIVQIGELFGYINKEGIMAISPAFVAAENFENGIADVMLYMANKPPKHSYIDKTGKPITNYDVVTSISDGMILVRKESKKGFINSSGKEIIPPQFEDAKHFKEGVAVVKVNSKWGYIDTTGKFIVQPQYDLIKDEFSEGKIGVQIDGKWGFINSSGDVIIKPEYEDVGSFSEGLATVTLPQSQGYIDINGKTVSYGYILAMKFEKVIARVKSICYLETNSGQMKDCWYLIDREGKQIGKTYIVKEINHFEDGIACVRWLDNTSSYIDEKGYLITENKFTRAEPFFRDGIAQVFIGKKMGYIDKTGKYIWEPSE